MNPFRRLTRHVRLHAMTLGIIFALTLGGTIRVAEAYGHYGTATVPINEEAATPLSATLETTALATTSAGCGKQAPRTGLFTLPSTDGNKKPRTYEILVPGDYQPSRAYALTFVFHGAGGSASQSYSWDLQGASDAAEKSIFVYPNGIAYKNYGIGWDDSKGGYDMPFFDNMVKAVEASYCVNSTRLFVAGFSWGGDFATALTCARGSTIRATAINSASDEYGAPSNYLTYANLPCPTATHPAVRFVHAVNGDSEYPAPVFAMTSSLLRNLDVCAATSKAVASSSSSMSCVSYNSCTKELIECNFSASIGHNLPPNWSKDTWAFFSTFP